MKRMTQVVLIVLFMFMCFFTTVYADSDEQVIQGNGAGPVYELKKHEEATLEGYKEKYGSDTYGVTAYILDKLRIYSIPLVFIGIAFSAVYQYVVGLKRLDVRDKGFNSMIAIITIGIIFQILPLVFAIVVTNTGNQ